MRTKFKKHDEIYQLKELLDDGLAEEDNDIITNLKLVSNDFNNLLKFFQRDDTKNT